MSDKIDLTSMNHGVLKKQHLTTDSEGEDILEVVKDIIGLHATEPLSPYLSLFARMCDFKRSELEDRWEGKKLLGKVRFVRKTLYLLPKESLPAAFAATQSMLIPRMEGYLQHLGLSPEDYKRHSQKILALFPEEGLTTKDVKARLQGIQHISPLLNLMCDQGLLIRGLPRSGWRSNLHTYYTMQDYFPDLELDRIAEEEARRLIVSRYLEVFGPVTLEDISWWTGFRKGEIKGLLRQREQDVCEIEVDDLQGKYWMLAADRLRMESERASGAAEVSLLPLLDPYLMGYKDRERFLRLDHFPYVYDRTGNATSVILVAGKVQGIWDYKAGKDRFLKLFWLDKPSRRIQDIIMAKAASAGKFLYDSTVDVKVCSSMTPLAKRAMGGFLAPLKDDE
jgi:hypothetical protein